MRPPPPLTEVFVLRLSFSSSTSQLWLAFWLFVSYLTVSLSLPITSLFVCQSLHLPTALGGLAVGIAFLSTILTRGPVGQQCDRLGGKPCMLRGLVVYTLASLLCAAAAGLPLAPHLAFGLLLVGRLLLGIGESLTLVGMISWGIALAGTGRSGRFMSWMGASMYGSFALGGPLGFYLYRRVDYAGTMLVCAALPLVGWLAVALLPGFHQPAHGERVPFGRTIRAIWRPGAVLGLQGVGFAALGAFLSLYFLARHWNYAGIGLSCFAAGFVSLRLTCGGLPDRIGGLRVARLSLLVEIAGQLLLWIAPTASVALLGALLTGVGCSMVFPAMGVEVVRLVDARQRGSAMGGFSAFQDLAYCLTGPLAGLLADRCGVAVVFLVGALAATLATALLVGSPHPGPATAVEAAEEL